jgi:hypothetical protein
MGSIAEAIYFFYSFGFVIARIVFVSIFGAFINEESQAGLPHLTSLPTEFYNEEVSFFTCSNKYLRFRITDSEINSANTYRFGRPDRS